MLTETPALKLNQNQISELLSQKKIAIVISRFNEKICDGLLQGARAALSELKIDADQVSVLRVPGAFEIPLVAKRAALSKKYAGVVALGCVIRGETPHFEYVSQAVSMGCLQAGLDTDCPVLFGVITVNNQEQAVARSLANEYNKGREAMMALFETLQTLERI